MDFYRSVSRRRYSSGSEGLPNKAALYQQGKQFTADKEAAMKSTMESAAKARAAERLVKSEEDARRITLEAYKRNVINKLYHYIPLQIMNEAFTTIMIKALPHDEDYIEACREQIETVNKIYLYHIGGVNRLKEQARRTGSNFLKKYYSIIHENSNKIIDDKVNKIKEAQTEDEVNAIIKSGIDTDDAEKITQDIDSLGTDEIAELVQNKVLDVVKDESKKQSEAADFKDELKKRAEEYETQDNETNDDSLVSGSENAEEEPDSSNTDEEDKQEEEPKTESSILTKYLVDPSIIHEHSLFYSIVNLVYKESIKSVTESGSEMEPKAPPTVLTSPLNLNMFDVYLNDYQNDMKDIDTLRIANKAPIAGDEVRIDSEDVLAEALMQYTMLETAMTIKLIDPTRDEVKAVADYNMKIK